MCNHEWGMGRRGGEPLCRPWATASFVRSPSVDQTVSVHFLIVFETLREKLSLSQFSSFGKLGDHYLAGLLQRTEMVYAKRLVRRVRERGAVSLLWSDGHNSPNLRQQQVARPALQIPWPRTALRGGLWRPVLWLLAPRPRSPSRLRPGRPEALLPGEPRLLGTLPAPPSRRHR